MNIILIDIFLLTSHLLLLGIKIFAVYILSKIKQKHIGMYIFSIIFLLFEIWFLLNFFVAVDLFYYEYLAILDEIIFTIFVISYLIKEVEQ